MDRLRSYVDLLRDRAVDLGLVASGDRERIQERHVDDSLQAAPLIRAGENVCDIGSGAGLPGIPLAIALPESRFVLVEPKRKAVAFLELVVDSLGLGNVEVVHRRVEDTDVVADVATTRAFGPVDRSWSAACGVLRPGGRLLYFAGASFDRSEAGSLRAPEPPASVEAVDSYGSVVMMIRSA